MKVGIQLLAGFFVFAVIGAMIAAFASVPAGAIAAASCACAWASFLALWWGTRPPKLLVPKAAVVERAPVVAEPVLEPVEDDLEVVAVPPEPEASTVVVAVSPDFPVDEVVRSLEQVWEVISQVVEEVDSVDATDLRRFSQAVSLNAALEATRGGAPMQWLAEDARALATQWDAAWDEQENQLALHRQRWEQRRGAMVAAVEASRAAIEEYRRQSGVI